MVQPHGAATWCHMLPHGAATWCHMVPHGATCCGTCCSHMLRHMLQPHVATWCHMVPHGATWCHVLPHSATWCHMVPHGATCCGTVSATCCGTPRHVHILFGIEKEKEKTAQAVKTTPHMLQHTTSRARAVCNICAAGARPPAQQSCALECTCVGLARTIYIWCIYGIRCNPCKNYRIPQMYTVLANPTHVHLPKKCAGAYTCTPPKTMRRYIHMCTCQNNAQAHTHVLQVARIRCDHTAMLST